MTNLDEHGQPMSMDFNWKRNVERDKENLLGLARRLIADGKLVDDEIRCLHEWLEKHAQSCREFPANRIHARIHAMLEDGVIDEEERKELFEILRETVGSDLPGAMAASELPLDQPPPELAHAGYSFCMTGKFAYGPRKAIEKEIEARGGFVHGTVTLSTDYLVIGTIGSRDWKHSAFGTKIETAMRYKEKGARIAIVSEDHWVMVLG